MIYVTGLPCVFTRLFVLTWRNRRSRAFLGPDVTAAKEVCSLELFVNQPSSVMMFSQTVKYMRAPLSRGMAEFTGEARVRRAPGIDASFRLPNGAKAPVCNTSSDWQLAA